MSMNNTSLQAEERVCDCGHTPAAHRHVPWPDKTRCVGLHDMGGLKAPITSICDCKIFTGPTEEEFEIAKRLAGWDEEALNDPSWRLAPTAIKAMADNLFTTSPLWARLVNKSRPRGRR